MLVQDTQVWEEVTYKVFNNCDYLLNESGIDVFCKHSYTGPGGDWDAYELFVEGHDSGRNVKLAADIDSYTSSPECDFWELAQELAYYIAESQGGELEEDEFHSTISITF